MKYNKIYFLIIFLFISNCVNNVQNNKKELIVKIASKTDANAYQNQGSSSAYFIDGEEAPYLKFTPGKTYKFVLEEIN